MSETTNERSAAAYRDTSSDVWFHTAVEAAASATQLRVYEATGEQVSWSDAAMNACAGRSGPLGDLVNGFTERLAEEYMRPEDVGHWIDNHESLPNVRAYLARPDAGMSLERAATSIVEAADRGGSGLYQLARSGQDRQRAARDEPATARQPFRPAAEVRRQDLRRAARA
ncbi:hypothetical protein ABZX12_41225 [Kribbella sp. NPDC003505]|uniref:hypothetical protein n=1 Tax=Kribbella sp. NPDC003505 TaxID=3154448 RepID=UPI0033BA2FAD